MPLFNRRRFLQLASAAGFAPALPALPAAAGRVAGATHAQAMFAKLYAHAGNVPNVQGLARALGVPNAMAKGLYRDLIRSHALSTSGISRLGHTMKPVANRIGTAGIGTKPPTSFDPVKIMRIITRNIDAEYRQPLGRLG